MPNVFLLIGKVLSYILLPLLVIISFKSFKDIFNNEPLLIINENGIKDNTQTSNTLDLIPWEEIIDMCIVPYLDNCMYICLKLKNPSKYIIEKPLGKFNRLKGFLDVNIYTYQFKHKQNEVANLISERIKLNKSDIND